MPSQPLRIAVGGFRHETNTFSPLSTTYADFRIARGDAVTAVGLAGLAAERQVTLLPTFVAGALPGGLVTQETYLRLKAELLDELAAQQPVAGILLDLHGAMEVAETGDAEGDFVAALRKQVGDAVLIAVSLDLHANVSPTLVRHANIITAFRTAPHLDYEETRQRALALLIDALGRGAAPHCALVKLPLLLAGESAVTTSEPAQSLYRRVVEMSERPGLLDVSLLISCAWTDSPETAVTTLAVADDPAAAQQAADELARAVWAERARFGFAAESAPVDAAVTRGLAAAERPVYLCDSGDNVTAGAAGDLPVVLARLLQVGAQEALVAGIADAEAVQRCQAAGVGATVQLTIGGKLDREHSRPLPVEGIVQRLITVEGDRYAGDGATLQIGGVTVLLSAARQPFHMPASIEAFGVDPRQYKLVVVKQGYLAPDLAEHAGRVIWVLSPGATDLRLEQLTYRRLPRPIYPLDGDFAWQP
jgi:microcystin degradation protein MlrC